jgi:hypothetical protein
MIGTERTGAYCDVLLIRRDRSREILGHGEGENINASLIRMAENAPSPSVTSSMNALSMTSAFAVDVHNMAPRRTGTVHAVKCRRRDTPRALV